MATGENAISSVSIRPNPAHDVVEVTVHSTNSGEINIRIFDVLGQEVCVKHNNPLQLGVNAYQVDLHTLPVGSYFLRIGNDVFGYSTQRLTKVK